MCLMKGSRRCVEAEEVTNRRGPKDVSDDERKDKKCSYFLEPLFATPFAGLDSRGSPDDIPGRACPGSGSLSHVGLTFHRSVAYSAMVRSDENFPVDAMFNKHILPQTSGFCKMWNESIKIRHTSRQC